MYSQKKFNNEHSQESNIANPLEATVIFLPVIIFQSPYNGNHYFVFSPHRFVMLIFKLHMNGIIQYTACTCVCLFILFNIMFVRSMKLVLVAVIHFYCTMYCYMFTPQFLLFILLSIDRLFLILNIMNNAFCTCLLVHAHMHFLQFLLVEWLGHRVCR